MVRYEVIWAKAAIEDLREISLHIEKDSPAQARRVAERILAVEALLSAHPRIGRQLPEFDDPDLRDWIVFNYRVIYRIRPNTIRIAMVLHGARDLSLYLKHTSRSM